MKQLMILLLLVAPLWGKISPCADSIFVKIKEVGFENLTAREFEYYKIKSSECEEYKTRQLILEQTQKQEDSQKNQSVISRASVKQQKEIFSVILILSGVYIVWTILSE